MFLIFKGSKKFYLKVSEYDNELKWILESMYRDQKDKLIQIVLMSMRFKIFYIYKSIS